MPEIKIGAPSIDGKYDVIEFDSERIETTMPHTMSIAPYPVVRFGRKLERSSMPFPGQGGLSVQFMLENRCWVDLITADLS